MLLQNKPQLLVCCVERPGLNGLNPELQVFSIVKGQAVVLQRKNNTKRGAGSSNGKQNLKTLASSQIRQNGSLQKFECTCSVRLDFIRLAGTPT